MEVSEITLFNTLKGSLGEEKAQVVVEGIKSQVKEALEDSKSVLATKEDLYAVRNELKGDIDSMRNELKGDIASVRNELKDDIASVRKEMADLAVRMEKIRADTIKWMFIFWAGQLAAIFGLLRVFFS